MSLVAWYPLNGNSKNYGAWGSALQPTESSVVYTDSGKIGKAMHTGSLTLSQSQMESWIGNTVSIAMWIYVKNDGSFSAGTPFFGYGNMTAPYNRKFSMFHYPNKNDFHCSWQNDSSDGTYWGCTYSNFFPTDTWTHLCLVQDGKNNKVYVYKNGSLYSESNVSGLSSMSITKAYGAPLRNSINYQLTNDIRIYNHALSKKEVREIYCHPIVSYDFNYNSLLYNRDNLYTGEAIYGKPSSSSYTITKKKTAEDGTYYNFKYDYDNTSGGNKWSAANWPVFAFTAGKYYKYSFEIRVNSYTSGAELNVYWGRISNDYGNSWETIASTTSTVGVWKKYEKIQIIPATVTQGSNTINSSPRLAFCQANEAGLHTVFDIDIRNCQIVEVDTATIADNSGYGNNGTTHGALLKTDQICRGDSSMYFEGTTSYCSFLNPKTDINKQDFSIAFAVRPSSSGKRNIYFGDYSLSGSSSVNIERNTSNQLRVYLGGSNASGDYSITNSTIPGNEWTHVVVTYSKELKTLKVYKNGANVYENTNVTSNQSKAIGTEWRLGRDSRSGTNAATAAETPLYGYMDYFNIYPVTLSSNDCEELYKTRVQIARDSSLFINHINEDGIERNAVFDYKMNMNINGIQEVDIKNKFDGNVYTEPDGSMWLRISHHANPASAVFGSGNDFANSVYVDSNRWFNAEVCNYLNSWELMIKQKATTGSELKYRWIQNKNPMSAAYADVAAASITKYYNIPEIDSKTLPKGYRGVRYIQSSGTQYINTEYAYTSEVTELYADIYITSNSSSQSLFGNEEAVKAGGRYFSGVLHGSNGSFALYLGSNSPVTSGISIPLNERHKLKLTTTSSKAYQLSINGTIVKSGTYSGSLNAKDNINLASNATATTIGHIFIFANHNTSNGTSNAAIQNVGGMRVYNFKIKENGKTVRDFIPCVRESDSVAGLYDIIEGKFYTTPTGSFSVGENALCSMHYSDFATGGLYKHGTNTYLCTNNGTSGNWWGAVGSWNQHGGGIPAWAGTIVTTGYCDLYVRIDNTAFTENESNFKSFNKGTVYSKNIIEY